MKTEDAYAVHLRRVHWQFWGVLTFRNEPKSSGIAKSMLYRTIRQLAKPLKLYVPNVPWCLRHELGEKFDRAHMHLMLAGFPREQATPALCRRIERLWQESGGGIAKISVFDPALGGVGYVTKQLGTNCHHLTLSAAVGRILSERARVIERRLAQ